MKKIFPILLALLALGACKNEVDNIFGDSAAERLNKTQAKYEQMLVASQYGWAFEYYPTSSGDDGALLYALYFDKDGSVTVAGDPWTSGKVKSIKSCWDIITDNGPTLSFSTYNELIHQFSDPMDDGSGYEGDYEFSFVYSNTENPDSVIMLKGKKRGLYSRLKMIDENLTPEEYLLDCTGKMYELFPTTAKNYVLLNIGNEEYRIDNMSSTIGEFYPYGKDKVLYAEANSYIFVKYGGRYYARFNKPFKTKDGSKSEDYFVYEPANNRLVGVNDPSITIVPPHMARFFIDELLGNTGMIKAATIQRNSMKSDSFAAIWNTASTAMSKKNYTLNGCEFSTNYSAEDHNCVVALKYKPKTGAEKSIYYKYNLTRDADLVTIDYVGPYNTGAETLLANVPECEPLLRAIAGKYKVENPNTDMQFVIKNVLNFVATDSDKSFATNLTIKEEQSKN
ncbi:MAG: DUF4302 domain-containing protein [Bacteroidaceae bacterium]|nr:DUF4302 domain-containing protein [Bacteroidaceae bacterium]